MAHISQGRLPTLEELRETNKGKDVPPETAWIWGADDEVYNSTSIHEQMS